MDLQIVRWIRGQDENGAVSMARTLCMAEAGRHRLDLGTVSFSARVKAKDQGIDGRTTFPIELDTLFPHGPHVWQIKSGSTTPSATAEFDPDKHAALVEAIKDGSDYVLFWTNDPTEQVRKHAREGFSDAVRKVRSDARAVVLFADEIERLCYQHLAVLAQHGPVPISGLAGLDIWAPREFELIEYQADDARLEAIGAIRKHVTDEEEPAEIHVFGDTGVGKSRLAYEALSQDGIRERVLVAPDPASWDHGLLTIVAGSPGSSLILVVDDCEAEDRKSLSRLVGMSRGRVRLVTIGSRGTRERPSEDRRRLEVLPLGTEASREIALSVGISEQDATVVANHTEGYPGLAATLARAIRYGSSDTTLLARIRGDDEIGPVLATLIDEVEVPLLGLLALFERIGFDGDLAPELTVACEIFGVDEAQVRAVADRELQRFVSTAGRFRKVTPRLFAVWLASQFMELRSATIAEELKALPESLRERIVEQMREFAGDPVVSRTLGELLEQAPFTSGAVAGVDEGAARLLHVAAIVTPHAAMDAIERILEEVTTDELVEVHEGRRGLVRSLEVLLWFEDLFERAADATVRLALAENESWSNNATGAVHGIFRVYLGGTSADYERRVRWARGAVDRFDEGVIPIMVSGLASAFDTHELRTAIDFGGRTAPVEWRPSNSAEEIAARRSAWTLLIDLAQGQPDSRDVVAESVARGIRTALRRGLSMEVLSTLSAVNWTARGRARLIEALNHAVAYDDLDSALVHQVGDLINSLAGADIEERSSYVLAASVWELTDDRDELVNGRPRVLLDLANDFAQAGEGAWIRLAEISLQGESDTVRRLFEELATVQPRREFLRRLEAMRPAPFQALIGYLRGLRVLPELDPVQVLERWQGIDDLKGAIVEAAHAFPASDELARLSLDAVDRGDVAPEELGRFLYGAWTQTLGLDQVAGVIARLARAVHSTLERDEPWAALRTLERALGIADQWLESNPVPARDTSFRATLEDLLEVGIAASSRDSSMLDLHMSHIIGRLDLQADERIAMLMRRLQALQSFPTDYELEELNQLSSSQPMLTVDAVIELLKAREDGQFNPGLMWLEDAKILSRLEANAGPDVVVERVTAAFSSASWPSLVGHIAFDTEVPDPLLVALLGESDDADLRERATFRFMHPNIVSTGPESENLRSRRNVAVDWRGIETLPPLFAGWLDGLLGVLDASISRAGSREAEERWP